ncbi:hypothetical protein [Crocosphaera sp.]|uniref:hypothetical protein n=1 Tax=Crocosphaera sp. TaxID=2729996 RepID=UPI00260C23C0|nr:hypothetical protein [Crocosphaera sp.]MDJ0579521.1 hypothetical protein [Crocosphaera sp.]
MNSQTFEVEIKDGILVIPPEIQNYIRKCQGNTKVSITITSSSDNSDDLKEKWERWFDEVEKIELSPSPKKNDQYGDLLIEKYKNQGLIL